MEVSELIKKYLPQKQIMQLATLSGEQPWICNLHYISDDSLNLYWLSPPTRRHSKEIEAHPKVATTIPIKFPDSPVVAVSCEGDAAEVTDKTEIGRIMPLYKDKFKVSDGFYNRFMAGEDQHRLYKVTPSLFVLFDEENFPENSRQEWKIEE